MIYLFTFRNLVPLSLLSINCIIIWYRAKASNLHTRSFLPLLMRMLLNKSICDVYESTTNKTPRVSNDLTTTSCHITKKVDLHNFQTHCIFVIVSLLVQFVTLPLIVVCNSTYFFISCSCVLFPPDCACKCSNLSLFFIIMLSVVIFPSLHRWQIMIRHLR